MLGIAQRGKPQPDARARESSRRGGLLRSRWLVPMVALALALSEGAALGDPKPRVVVVPFENLGGKAAVGREVAALMSSAVKARGYLLADPENLEALLEDERIRYLDSLTPAQLTRLATAASAEFVLLGSVYTYDEGPEPIVAVAARLVDRDGRVRSWDVEAVSAEDTIGVLGQGRLGSARELARLAVRRLAVRLPLPGDARRISSQGVPRFLGGPISYRSPYLPLDDRYQVVILPLGGWVGSGGATKIVAALLARRLEATGHFRVIEPATVRRALIDLKLWGVASLDPDAMRRLGEQLGAPYFIRGTLYRFEDGRGQSSRAPRVELSLTMVDARRERIVWMGYHARSGADYQGLLELGKVTTAVALADHVIAELVAASEKAADPGQALKTVGRRHLLEQQARAERAEGQSSASTPKAGPKPLKKLTPEEVAKAREHVQKGMAASEAGRNDEALAELTQAFALTEDPRLFFYVGSIHDRAGHVAEAIAAYQRYVTEAKVGAQQTGPVKKRIKELEAEAARAEKEKKGTLAPAPEEQPPAAEPPKAEPPKAEPPKAEPPKAEPAPGASELTPQQQRRVSRRLAAARRAEKAEQFYAAFLELRAAYRLSQDPETLGRLARAADRAGRAEAAELYRRYLGEADVPAAAREEIEKRLEELAADAAPNEKAPP